MSEIIVLIIFLFFAVCGVSTITAKLWLFLVRPQNKRKSVCVVNVEDDLDEANFFYITEKYRWYGKDFADYIVFVTDSKVSERMSGYLTEYKNIYCCSQGELKVLLKKLTEEEYERSEC